MGGKGGERRAKAGSSVLRRVNHESRTPSFSSHHNGTSLPAKSILIARDGLALHEKCCGRDARAQQQRGSARILILGRRWVDAASIPAEAEANEDGEGEGPGPEPCHRAVTLPTLRSGRAAKVGLSRVRAGKNAGQARSAANSPTRPRGEAATRCSSGPAFDSCCAAEGAVSEHQGDE